MLPKYHIILGAVFSAVVWFLFPGVAWYSITLIFLSSFLIDFDHYMCSVLKNKSLSLSKALKYYYKLNEAGDKEFKIGIKRKGDFHVFHTVEFHAFVLITGLFFQPFLFIFMGMVFHSLMDLIDLSFKERLYRREFLLTNWISQNYLRRQVSKPSSNRTLGAHPSRSLALSELASVS